MDRQRASKRAASAGVALITCFVSWDPEERTWCVETDAPHVLAGLWPLDADQGVDVHDEDASEDELVQVAAATVRGLVDRDCDAHLFATMAARRAA